MMIIRDKDRLRLLKIIDKHFAGSVEVWAYGSRVNGDCHDASDLDLVIRTKTLEPVDIDLLNKFRWKLRDSNIPILISVMDWARMPRSFHGQILKRYEVVYEFGKVESDE